MGKKAQSSSKLDSRVQDLVKLIFDLKMMENVMTEMEYDIKKMPLGKLTKGQIKNGYEVLKKLDEAIQKNKGYSTLEELSSEFYTLIPHALGITYKRRQKTGVGIIIETNLLTYIRS
jgi:poly [ADP-ribose] polymerase